MKRYTVAQGFHLGEICQDIIKGTEISFDETNSKLYLGKAEFRVRCSPILGAIKKGWLRFVDDIQEATPDNVKFEGVEESRPISLSAEKPTSKERNFDLIQYEEDSKPISEETQKENTSEKPLKIGFENREDSKASISFDTLKSLENVKDDDVIKSWDLNKHWAIRKKEMLKITNINTLMKIAVLDKTLKKYIESRIKELSPLGKEVEDIAQLENTEVEELKIKKTDSKSKIEVQKAEKPNTVPMGKDFDEYMSEQIKENKIQIPKSKS